MHAFKDTEGREWHLTINVSAVKRARGLAGVDLLGLVDDDFRGLAGLLSDIVKLVDLIYVLCVDQAEKRGVTDEDFGRAFSGDVLKDAADAFLAEYADFFPDPRRRAGIRGLFAKTGKVAEILMERAAADLDAIDPASLAERLIASSGGSPGSSGSTPAPSPSASST